MAEEFPDAKLLYMLRTPEKTIPSTISLNANIYSILSNGKQSHLLNERTRDTVIAWYKSADQALLTHWNGRNMVVHFNAITQEPRITLEKIYSFLELKPDALTVKRMKEEQEKAVSYATTHRYDNKAGLDGTLIQKELSGLHVGFQ